MCDRVRTVVGGEAQLAIREASRSVTRAEELDRGSGELGSTRDATVLYAEHASRVRGLIRRLVKDPHTAEDLVQETFLRAHRSLHTLENGRSEWPWLATIAKRLCIDEWRWRDPSSEPLPEHDDLCSVGGSIGEDLADVVVAKERRLLLEQTLGSLHPRHRRLLVLKYIDGWRHQDIVVLEGTTSEALRAALMRARQSFRRQYEAACRERGLTELIWPVLAPIATLARSLRHRTQQAGIWMQRAFNIGILDVTTSGLASPIATGLLVLATFSGAMSIGSPTATSAARRSQNAASRHATQLSSLRRFTSAASRGATQPAAAPSPPTLGATTPSSPVVGSNLSDPAGSGGAAAQQQARDVAPVQPSDITDPNQNVARPEDAQSSSIVFSPATSQTVFLSGRNTQCATTPGACPAVLYESTDGGTTWTRLVAQGFDGDQILLPPAYGAGDDRIFAMTHAGVLLVSSDGGSSFAPAATGAPAEGGLMTISPGFDQGDPRILVGTQSNLMQYLDDTRVVSPAAYSSLPGSLDPMFAPNGVLFVGGRQADQTGRLGSTVFRCAQAVCDATRISDAPETPHIRLSPTSADGSTLFAFTSRSVVASADGGHTFTALATPTRESVLLDLAVGNQTLFAAAYDPAKSPDAGLYVSKDGGASWARVANPLFDSGVLVVRTSGSRVIAGLARGGVACSADAGMTWAARC